MARGWDVLLRQVWTRVREDHLFPELPQPRWTDGEERVALEIKDKRISLSRPFVMKMSEALPQAEVMEGLLDHAVSHHLSCPWDFVTHLKLYGEAKRTLKDPRLAQIATDMFMDVVADTYVMRQKDSPLPKLYPYIRRDEVDEAIHALYQRIWGVDLGIDGHETVSRRLSRIPYLDRRRWRDSIRRFSKILHALLVKEQEQEGAQDDTPMGNHDLQQYSAQEVESGLQDLAQDAASPAEFKEMVEDFEEDILEATEPTEEGMGLGPGRSIDADILYYMKLAENYALPVCTVPTKKSGSLYPHHHAPWEVGMPYQEIDPWTSFGKIMPGITQIWKRREGDIFGEEEDVPDCLILIDSSGSMPNPKRHLSHAVLGAACAAEAYLRRDARVAVYNFSDAHVGGRRSLTYTDRRFDIYRTLCHYFGGGTRLQIEDIEALQTDEVPDIFLITDMQITNLAALIELFNQRENRVTAVHIGDNDSVKTFRRSMAPRKNVSIFAVEDKQSIPAIVLGKVKEYLYS
jgi:hypothetical protein